MLLTGAYLVQVLTLPNGERIKLPSEVRILFEVADLRHATLATVSRCGMVYFGAGTFDVLATLHAFLARLRTRSLLNLQQLPAPRHTSDSSGKADRTVPESTGVSTLQLAFASALEPAFAPNGFISRALAVALGMPSHVMPPSSLQGVGAVLGLLRSSLRSALESGSGSGAVVVMRHLLFSTLWGLAGSLPHTGRLQLAAQLCSMEPDASPLSGSLLDWQAKMPQSASPRCVIVCLPG